MGRPRGIWTPDVVRKRIQTTKLVQRLQNHVLGTLRGPPTEDEPEGRVILMLDSQVRAACFLIERSLPKAESPRDIHVTGTVTLKQLIEGTQSEASRPDAG